MRPAAPPLLLLLLAAGRAAGERGSAREGADARSHTGPLPARGEAAAGAGPAFDMSPFVGAEYTPWRAVNQLWWHDYAAYRADVARELKAVQAALGFTSLRVFLHDMVWAADPGGLADNVADFLSLVGDAGMTVGFVFFDDDWRGSGVNLTTVCTPVQGVHNGCWIAGPQAVNRTDVDRFEDYVSKLVARFAHDKRVAWWEIVNEPHSAFGAQLSAAGLQWALAQKPAAPVLNCADGGRPPCSSDANGSQVVNAHQYYAPVIPPRHGGVFSNPAKGGIVTEAGCRWYQGANDQGGPMTWVHWLTALRNNASLAPFVPGVMLSWEVMVGHSMTRWHWAQKAGTPEPAIPWCGSIYPDGTPVSYTEAAALRRYTGGRDDLLFVASRLDAPGAELRVDAAHPWGGWAPAAPPAAALYELAVWPEGRDGALTVAAGAYTVTLDAPPKTAECSVAKELGCYNHHNRGVLPTPYMGATAPMSHAVCADAQGALGAGGGDACGCEDGGQCWCGTMKGAEKVNDSACGGPCPGDASEKCGGPYIIWAFTTKCTPTQASAQLRVAQAGREVGSAAVSDRLVGAAWNLLRILVEPGQVRVWLNPTFADVTGASAPPADEAAPPHAPAPVLLAATGGTAASGGAAGLSATATGGAWRIDYASVLPPTLFGA